MRGFKKIPWSFWFPARLSFGLFKPKNTILGNEFAGEVEATGKDVTVFKQSDKVFGFHLFGTNAEYISIPEKGVIAKKPDRLTDEQAAAIPFGSLAALYFLKKARIKSGEHILINGAAGAVGSYAVQLARYFGTRVTGVCHTTQMEQVQSLGANTVIDYTQEDFTKRDTSYDIIFDTVGVTSFSRCKKVLNANGRYVLTVFGLWQLLQMLWTSISGNKKVICGIAEETQEDILFIKQCIEEEYIKPVIDKTFTLAEMVEAHRYAEKGSKKGSIVITINHE
ncbi:MAG: zinc-binding dehydrogenase [Elusimicrobia bacterium]|nr:zinc-binding dehydrogenase [Elusimicrobiota bacterium]